MSHDFIAAFGGPSNRGALLGAKPGARAIGAVGGGRPFVYYTTGNKRAVVLDANGNTYSNTRVEDLPSPAPMRSVGWNYIQCAVKRPERAIWTNGATATPNPERVFAYTKNGGITWLTVELSNLNTQDTIRRAHIDNQGKYAYFVVFDQSVITLTCPNILIRIDQFNLDTGVLVTSFIATCKGGGGATADNFGYCNLAATPNRVIYVTERQAVSCADLMGGFAGWAIQTNVSGTLPASLTVAPPDPSYLKWASSTDNLLAHCVMLEDAGLALITGSGTTAVTQTSSMVVDVRNSTAFFPSQGNGVKGLGWGFNRSGTKLMLSRQGLGLTTAGLFYSIDRGNSYTVTNNTGGVANRFFITCNPFDPENTFLAHQNYLGDGGDATHIYVRRYDNPLAVEDIFAEVIGGLTFNGVTGSMCSGLPAGAI